MAGKQYDSLEVRELVVSDKWSLMPALAPTATQAGYAVTNMPGADDRALNCNEEAGALLVADVLGTLIKDLIAKGVIDGTTA